MLIARRYKHNIIYNEQLNNTVNLENKVMGKVSYVYTCSSMPCLEYMQEWENYVMHIVNTSM